MNKVGAFDLSLEKGRNARKIKVDVFTDSQDTIIRLDCACCPELLASKLPGGVIIPIATTLKVFFENLEMRNLEVNVDRDFNIMERIYKGILDKASFDDMKKKLIESIKLFNNKRQI
jgi:hypothetical protein